MKDPADVIGRLGLVFFGRISASISHELKNCLSIINESAGLLEDLVMISQKGSPIDPARLLTTSKRIQQQVIRADQILRNMNQFSHSTDHPLVNIDIRDLLGCLLAVTKRITDMKGVTVSYAPGETAKMINTDPFWVMMLIWQLLQLLIERLNANKNIECEVKKTEQGLTVGLFVSDDINNMEGLLEEVEQSLMSVLGASISADQNGFLISLTSQSDS
jgi:signal transduction histidine kinase